MAETTTVSSFFPYICGFFRKTLAHFRWNTLYTQCMSTIQALACPSATSNTILQIKQLCCNLQGSRTFSIFWVKGHSGIHGNELEGVLANSARLSGLSVHLLMSRTYIKCEMHKETFNIWNSTWQTGGVDMALFNWIPSMCFPIFFPHRRTIYLKFLCLTVPFHFTCFGLILPLPILASAVILAFQFLTTFLTALPCSIFVKELIMLSLSVYRGRLFWRKSVPSHHCWPGKYMRSWFYTPTLRSM